MSAEGMFDRFGDQFETAMLFLPVAFVITDTMVKIEHGGYRQTTSPTGLGRDMTGHSLMEIRAVAHPRDWSRMDELAAGEML